MLIWTDEGELKPSKELARIRTCRYGARSMVASSPASFIIGCFDGRYRQRFKPYRLRIENNILYALRMAWYKWI